jgi:hypothetical protein
MSDFISAAAFCHGYQRERGDERTLVKPTESLGGGLY